MLRNVEWYRYRRFESSKYFRNQIQVVQEEKTVWPWRCSSDTPSKRR